MNLNLSKNRKYRLIILIGLVLISVGTSLAFYYNRDIDYKIIKEVKPNKENKKIVLGNDQISFVPKEIKINDVKEEVDVKEENLVKNKYIPSDKKIGDDKETKTDKKYNYEKYPNLGGSNQSFYLTPIDKSKIDPETKIPYYNNKKHFIDILSNLDTNYNFKYGIYDNSKQYSNTELLTSIEGFNADVFEFAWSKLFSKYINNLEQSGYPLSLVNTLNSYEENNVAIALLGTDAVHPDLKSFGSIKKYEKNVNLSEFSFSKSEIYHIKILSILYPDLDRDFYNSYCKKYTHPNCSSISKNETIFNITKHSFIKNKKLVLNRIENIFNRNTVLADTSNIDFSSLTFDDYNIITSSQLDDVLSNLNIDLIDIDDLIFNTILAEVSGLFTTLQFRGCGAKRAVEGSAKPLRKLYSGVAACSICKNVLCLGIIPGFPPKITFYSYLWSLENGARCGCSEGLLPGF